MWPIIGGAVLGGIDYITGGGVSDFVGDVWSDVTGQTAASEAAAAQQEGVDAATQVQREALEQQMQMFRENQEMLSPFVQSAEGAMGQMGALSGTQGMEAQQAAINELQNSPLFQAQVQQGEDAMLQNASATGGLRGGNTQAALAQFRPQMLQQEINQQYDRLGGIANLGMGPISQTSANFGSMAGATGQSAASIGSLLTQAGQAQAANRLAQYQLPRDFIMDLGGLGISAAGLF